MAPTLAPIADVTLFAGAPLHIALDGFDADGDTLSYTASSTNADVTTFIPEGNRSLRISVQDFGQMEFQLFEGRAPNTTSRIIQLAQEDFFDGVIFHRVIKDFMIQGGDPTGTGSGGSGVDFDDEYHPDLQHTSAGILSMAKTSDDTNDSQSFITAVPTRWLDYNHSIFGFLTEGDDVREQIENVATGANNRPLVDVVMSTVEVFTDIENGVLMLSAPEGATGEADITVTVSDGDGTKGEVQQTFRVSIVPDTSNANPYLDPIPPIVTSQDTPVSFTLPAIDVEGDPIVYRGSVEPPNADLSLVVSEDDGQATLTPTGGLIGVYKVSVGVRSESGNWNHSASDNQLVPVFINPPAPSDIQLMAGSDTGLSNSDGLTSLNNADAGHTLRFSVSGVETGAEVTLFADGQQVGQAIAQGNSVEVATDGTTELADGTRSITAVQTLRDQAVEVGNLHDTVDLQSDVSAPIEITVDTRAPQLDPIGDQEVAEGSLLTFAATATDENTPLAFGIDPGAPAGATIDPDSGVFAWTPSEAQGPGEYPITIRVTDVMGRTDEQSFRVIVEEVDQPAEFAAVETQVVAPGEELRVPMQATDPDVPTKAVSYNLEPGAPAGAAIDPDTGLLTWSVPEDSEPQIVRLTVRATEIAPGEGPGLSSVATVKVIVIGFPVDLDAMVAARATAAAPLGSTRALPDGLFAAVTPPSAQPDTFQFDFSRAGPQLSSLFGDGGLFGTQIGPNIGLTSGAEGAEAEEAEPSDMPAGDNRTESDRSDDESDNPEGANQSGHRVPKANDVALALLVEDAELAAQSGP